MSPRWNKSLSLFIGTEQLQASLRPPWWQRRAWARRLGGEVEIRVTLPLDHAMDQALERALNTLFAELEQQAPIRQAQLQVTVADSYGHFDVVAGDYADYSDPELQAIALGCVAELMGDAANEQSVRWQLQPDGRHLLLCALDQQLVDSVQRAAQTAQLQLVSLQPAFCRQWNRHGQTLPRGSGIFSVADAHHCLVSCAQRGSITALSYGAGPGLDLRTNRLLAGLRSASTDAASPSSAETPQRFVLVAPAAQTLTQDPRWTLLDGQELAP